VFSWLKRWKKPASSGAKRSMRRRATDTVPVEIPEFAPGILPFLGMTAYLQLSLYEAATQAVSGAVTLEAKEVLAEVAGDTLQKHHRFTHEIQRRGYEPHKIMRPYAPIIERYTRRVAVPDLHQHVLAIWLVGGLFDEFFADLAGGMNDKFSSTAAEILRENSGRNRLQELLLKELKDNPAVADSLALWGRRLVGDTLLLAREVLRLSEHQSFDAEKMEPVFTELTGAHMRRMDSLGLTA
jgi:hypothetical protein